MSIYEEPEIKVDFAASEELQPLAPEVQNKADPLNSGFLWYTPPMASTTDGQHSTSDGHTWVISGHDMQVLTTTIPPGETFVTEIGSFLFGSSGVKMDVECTMCLCGNQGCKQAWSRICGGESCVKLLLTNESSTEGFLGITPNYPAKIIPIKVCGMDGRFSCYASCIHALTYFYYVFLLFSLVRMCRLVSH